MLIRCVYTTSLPLSVRKQEGHISCQYPVPVWFEVMSPDKVAVLHERDTTALIALDPKTPEVRSLLKHHAHALLPSCSLLHLF